MQYIQQAISEVALGISAEDVLIGILQEVIKAPHVRMTAGGHPTKKHYKKTCKPPTLDELRKKKSLFGLMAR